jgi:transcription elongation factor GreA
MSDFKYFTPEGLEKLKSELHKLKNEERPSISRQIQEAREKGDLSENAEYDAAKEAQGMLELRISKLEGTLAQARIMDTSNIDTSKVLALSTVKLKNHNTGKEMKYTLVSEEEANLKEGKISVESPIGRGLLGKTAGDIAEVKVPAGLLKLEILNVSR